MSYELDTLAHPSQYIRLMAYATAVGTALFLYNRAQAKSAVLYFEELPPELITRLGLIYVPPAEPTSSKVSSS